MLRRGLALSAKSQANVELLREQDRHSFLISFFLPKPKQDAYIALCAFYVELLRVSQVTSNQTAALLRFAWWRDEVKRAFTVRGSSPRCNLQWSQRSCRLLATGNANAISCWEIDQCRLA